MAQYTVGDNVTIQCPLTLQSTGGQPDFTGASLLTILVWDPNGVLATLTAVPYSSGTVVGVQAPYVHQTPGVYRGQAQVGLADGTRLTEQPVRAWTVNAVGA